MEDITKMTDKEVKSEYKMYYDMIHNEHRGYSSCYSARDMRWLDALEVELLKRGYELEYWTTLKFIKNPNSLLVNFK